MLFSWFAYLYVGLGLSCISLCVSGFECCCFGGLVCLLLSSLWIVGTCGG